MAKRNEKYYTCCPEPYPDITFRLKLRRKSLFFTVNLIFPCAGLSLLTLFVFLLPAASKEKITLAVAILLASFVLLFYSTQIVPPTSLVVPLISKYLLFTMLLAFASVVVTVVILNVHFRNAKVGTSSFPRRTAEDVVHKSATTRKTTRWRNC